MKAAELQLGNLVMLGDKIIRVDAIHKRKVGYHARFDKLNFVFEDRLNPIPLTTEIIEKNGFKSELGLGGRFILEIESFNCRIKFSAIDYVHELQNTLTLCKIYKKIIL